MKIGIICYPTFGGSGVIATELGATLCHWGHEVHLFSYAVPSRLNADCAKLCVHQVEDFSYPLFKYPHYDLALASRLIEVAEGNGLDIVHAHYAIPHSISAFLARESVGGKFKTVTTLHGTDITLVGSDRSYYPMTRLGIEMSDAVTSVSQHLKKETEEVFKPKKKIDVIYNFIDEDLFRPAEQREARKEKTIVHVSNFRPVKRIDDIVHAFDAISKALPSRLLLVGEGPEVGRIRKLVEEKGLNEKVQFLGNQTAVHEILQKADLCVLASETESFGLSALEAMACGIPVVAPREGGLPEVITDGEDGALVVSRNPKALANASIEILKDEALWTKYSAAARKSSVERFSKEKIVGEYQKLYEKVLGG